jgi:hypothetical protein
MADYEQIIAGIHTDTDEASGYIIDEHDYIQIDRGTRMLSLPEGFNATVAYAGDINSQIVKFLCPKTYDKHSLANCSKHEIRWYNTGSGISSTSPLHFGENVGEYFTLAWPIPPEATTKNGVLEIVISIYDEVDEIIKYQWNTAPFRSLLVGETLENVDVKAPEKNKILTLNTNTRKITLPSGYNTTIATQGDVGITEVYIETSRYIGGMDLLDEKVNTIIRWEDSQGVVHSENCATSKMYSIIEEDDLVLITWRPSPALINHYAGMFSFYVLINKFANAEIEKQWYSLANE